MKLDLEHARGQLKEMLEKNYDIVQEEEVMILWGRYKEEMIDDLKICLTTRENDDGPLVVESTRSVFVPSVTY